MPNFLDHITSMDESLFDIKDILSEKFGIRLKEWDFKHEELIQTFSGENNEHKLLYKCPPSREAKLILCGISGAITGDYSSGSYGYGKLYIRKQLPTVFDGTLGKSINMLHLTKGANMTVASGQSFVDMREIPLTSGQQVYTYFNNFDYIWFQILYYERYTPK